MHFILATNYKGTQSETLAYTYILYIYTRIHTHTMQEKSINNAGPYTNFQKGKHPFPKS